MPEKELKWLEKCSACATPLWLQIGNCPTAIFWFQVVESVIIKASLLSFPSTLWPFVPWAHIPLSYEARLQSVCPKARIFYDVGNGKLSCSGMVWKSEKFYKFGFLKWYTQVFTTMLFLNFKKCNIVIPLYYQFWTWNRCNFFCYFTLKNKKHDVNWT